MRHPTATLAVFRTSYQFQDGFLHPDEHAASRDPNVPAYLPVNRLADGSVHDW